MKQILAIFLLLPAIAFGATADALNTSLSSGNGGDDVFTYRINSSNDGIGVYPKSASLPLNASGNIPYALTVGGDTFNGDLYCLAETDYASVFPGAWGCVYGKAANGHRVGPMIYQVNKFINADGGTGGPGMIMWADTPNADKSGNRGYYDIWAWGQNDTEFSNTLNFGNRDSAGTPHRRFRIRNTGQINLPDLAGTGNAHLCIDAGGNIYRGTASGC